MHLQALWLLVLPHARALDAGLRITVQSKFVSNASDADTALDRLASAQRLRDDLAVADARTAVGGWTVEIVSRSTEYEKVADVETEIDDDAEAEISSDSPQLELSEKRVRALPYRVARDVKNNDDPLKRWRTLVEDFPAYRKSLSGPMPKKTGDTLVEAWTPPALDHLWVCGVDVTVRLASPYDVVRDAFQAVDAHTTRVEDLAGVGLALETLAARPQAPARLITPDALDGGVEAVYEVYDTREEDDAEGLREPVRVQFFVDPSQKGHVTSMLEAIEKFWNLEDAKRSRTPVVIKVYLLDARCRAALAWLQSLSRPYPAKRRFLEALQFRVYGELLDDHILISLKKALDKKDRRVPLPNLRDLVARIGPGFDEDFEAYGLFSATTPFLLADGRVVELDPSEPDRAGETAAAAIDRVANKHVDDQGPHVAFYHPLLTPRLLIWPETMNAKERLFADEFPTTAAPDPRVPTLYAGAASSSNAWERALTHARPETVVVRDAPVPKKVSKKKRKFQVAPPFLACNGIVVPLTEHAFPAAHHAPEVSAALLPCARRLASIDARPPWEPVLKRAPAALKHVFEGDAHLEALALVDPVSRAAPVIARILETLRDDLGFAVTLAFAPQPQGGDLRSWARTSVYGDAVTINQNVLGSSSRLRLALRAPETWRLGPPATSLDVSNFAPGEARGAVAFDVDALIVQGKTSRRRFAAFEARGQQCVRVDGVEVPALNGDYAVVLDARLAARIGAANVSITSMHPRTLPLRAAYGVKACAAKPVDDGRVHVFSVASGAMYERLLKVMMGSVVLRSSREVTFWVLREFLSSKFVAEVPALEAALEAQIRFPPAIAWPEFLVDATGAKVGIRDDLQRLVWASKLLFLDGLFHNVAERVIFVDADAVVVGDITELLSLDLGMAPYAMAPFCGGDEVNNATKGHRFWEAGFWAGHLAPHNQTYKISALFVVEVPTFALVADGLRTTYQYMAPDANSLQNLDQDLPNYLNGGDRRTVALASLPDEWLYCESWCNAKAKAKAKAFDMCQNPATKEYKLDVARRVADPLWSALDGYFGSSMAEPISSLRAPAGSNWKWAVRGASADRGGEL